MNLIPLDEVVVPSERYRKSFDQEDLDKLARSILEVGLLHPPVLRNANELVAGESRYRALCLLRDRGETITHIGEGVAAGAMPFVIFEDLSDLKARQIELEENLIRAQLSWQDEASATAEFHALKKTEDPIHTLEKTAKEIGSYSKQVRNRIALAKNLHRPEVKAARTEKDAIRTLRNSLERDMTKQLNKALPKRKSPHQVEVVDALVGLASLPSETFSVIVTDPPWGIGADKFHMHQARGTGKAHTYKDGWDDVQELWECLAVEGYRVANSQAHLYAFCGLERFYYLADKFTEVGWTVWPRPIIWYKGHGPVPKPDLGPSYCYEPILYANKGGRPTKGTAQDVIEYKTQPGISLLRAAAKPVEVYQNLLARSIIPGDRVLDPFCGTGPIFTAAGNLGCLATGFDIDEDAIEIARERIFGGAKDD